MIPGPRVKSVPGFTHLCCSSPQTSSSMQVQPMPCMNPPSTCRPQSVYHSLVYTGPTNVSAILLWNFPYLHLLGLIKTEELISHFIAIRAYAFFWLPLIFEALPCLVLLS